MLAIRNRINSISSFQILAIVFAFAFLVRLGFLTTKPHAWVHRLQAGDEPLYHGLAVNLLRGNGYSFEGAPRSYPPPLYPIFIAWVYRIAGISPPAVRIGNALLGAVLCLLIALWAMKLWGRFSGLVAGIAASLYYPFVQLPTYLMTENLYLPAFVAAVMVSWQLVSNSPSMKQWLRAMLAGTLWSLSALTREIAKPVALLTLVWLAFHRKWKEAVIVAIAVTLVGLPWSVRNRLVFGSQAHSPVSDYELSQVPLPLRFMPGGLLYMSFGPSGDEPKILGHWNWGSDVKRPEIPKGLSPVERDSWLRKQAWEHIKTDPKEAVINRIPRKLANLLSPFYGTASLPNKVLSTLCYLVLLLLSIPSLIQAWRSKDTKERTFAELVIVAALFTISFHAIFYGVVRYRYPIDTLLLVAIGRWMSERKEEPLAVVG